MVWRGSLKENEYTTLTWAVIRSHNYGLPMNISSSTGPAEHCAGGSRAKLLRFLLICFSTIVCAFCLAPISVCAWRSGQNSWWSQWLGRIVSSSHTGSARHRHRGPWNLLKLQPWPPPCLPDNWCIPGPMYSYTQHEVIVFLFLRYFFWSYHVACGILVPWPGTEPRPQKWEPGILTTRPPGHSL